MLAPDLQKVLDVMRSYDARTRASIAYHYDTYIPEKFMHISNNKHKLNYTDLLKMRDLSSKISYYKNAYNIARPFVRSPEIKSIYVPVITSNSPSYPSGHAATYRLLYLIYAKKDPANKQLYHELASIGMLSRVIAGVHTFNDIYAGVELANSVYNY